MLGSVLEEECTGRNAELLLKVTSEFFTVYVNKVRRRPSTNLPALENSAFSGSLVSKDAFLKRLQMERALELCFEVWRWADLKRWGLVDTQAGIGELKLGDPDFNNFVLGRHHRLPIPQVEVDNSEGELTQHFEY